MFNRHTRNAEILLGNPCMISTISLKQSECISEHLRSVCTVLHVIYSIVRGHNVPLQYSISTKYSLFVSRLQK